MTYTLITVIINTEIFLLREWYKDVTELALFKLLAEMYLILKNAVYFTV